eukprot:GFUD01085381.1.p1 GENE.GFUD01085381.1~~GFUD01085381.1.p1  ORF type:complete len:113 (-),score=21.73 GFUD01085381.1:101-439(-)
MLYTDTWHSVRSSMTHVWHQPAPNTQEPLIIWAIPKGITRSPTKKSALARETMNLLFFLSLVFFLDKIDAKTSPFPTTATNMELHVMRYRKMSVSIISNLQAAFYLSHMAAF